jgi:hypothetical protein
MLKILGKKSWLAIAIVTAASINIDVRVANADALDNIVNRCFAKANSVGLTPQEARYCNRTVRLKIQRDNQIQNRNNSLNMYRQSLDNYNQIINQGAEPVIIRPTNFGGGN